MQSRAHVLAMLLIVSLIPFADASPALAARPCVVLFYGGALATPIAVNGCSASSWLLAGPPAPITPAMLEGRPSFQLAFFWNAIWVDDGTAAASPDWLRPEQANQYGRFYPALGVAPAILAMDFIAGPGTLFWYLQPEGLRLLEAHGVPTRSPFPATALFYLVPIDLWPWVGLGLLIVAGFRLSQRRQARRTAQ